MQFLNQLQTELEIGFEKNWVFSNWLLSYVELLPDFLATK